MARKKIEIVVIDGIESKECTKCGEVKALSEYGKERSGLGGKKSQCKVCRNSKNRKHYQVNKERVKERVTKYYQENKENVLAYLREYRVGYYQVNKENVRQKNRKHYQENKELYKVKDQRRRAIKRQLPATLTSTQTTQLLQRGCALTGSYEDLHLDHFIPLSWGRGGTIIENMIPLNGSLNMSKQDANPFEWIKREDIRGIVDMTKWYETIDYLANLNGMTTQEFEEYVYWCEENKRDLTATA